MSTMIRIAALLAATALAPGIAHAQPATGTPNFLNISIGSTGPATCLGSSIGCALGPLVNFQGSGHPGLLLSDRLILNHATPSDTDFAVLQIGRTTTFTSTNHSNINQGLVVSSTIGPNDGSTAYSTLTKMVAGGPALGLGVSHYMQAIRPGADSTPPSSPGEEPMWVQVLESRDQTNLNSNAVTGQQVNTELDLIANKVDDATNLGTFWGTGNRKGLHIVTAQDNNDPANPAEFSNLIWVAARAQTYVDSVLGFAVSSGGGQVRNVIDTRGAVPVAGQSNPVAAVEMSAGHVIDFSGGPNVTSAPGAYLQYRTATNRLYYVVGGVDEWSVDSSGNVRARGTVTGSTTP